MSGFMDAALYYASLGWRVLPLAPGQKTPITPHGCKDATTDSDTIKGWWEKWPSANIGLACGQSSGVYVLDIDIKDQINGFDSLKEFPALPATVCQDTPRGGKHYLYRADIAPANRNSFRPGIDVRCEGYYIVLAPSTHPNGGLYAWASGRAPWEIGLSEFPEFMRPATQTPWSGGIKDVPLPIKTPSKDNSNVLQRASLYLAMCDPAIQGSCGHNKLLWAATALVHGFLLGDNDAYDLLVREYNPRCVPPWDLSIQKDFRDFCRKISEAKKLTPQHEEGWLLNDDFYCTGNDCNVTIDVPMLLLPKGTDAANSIPANRPQTTCTEGEYQFLVRPVGLTGAICSWLNATAMKEQPFLSLACTLAFMGALFGRKVRDQYGSRTNLYCMGVAPSSSGKAHAMNQIRRLATASGCISLLGGDDVASDAAIEYRVSKEPSTLFMWDEIGHLLAHIKSGISKHHAQIVSLLMKLYSAAGNTYLGKEYAEQDKQRVIVQPCCSVYGTSTIERFTNGLSPMELQDGWLSRCLVFRAPMNSPKKRGRSETAVPKQLIERVSAWKTRSIASVGSPVISQFVNPSGGPQPPGQIVVPTTPEAEQLFVEFDNTANEYGSKVPTLIRLWAKAEENARRVALIVACGESFDHPVITISIADYACRLIQYILIDFGTVIVPDIVAGEISLNKRLLFKIIESFGKDGCAKSSITRASQSLRKEERNRLIDDLIEGGEIAVKRTQVAKTTLSRYWTAENYSETVTK